MGAGTGRSIERIMRAALPVLLALLLPMAAIGPAATASGVRSSASDGSALPVAGSDLVCERQMVAASRRTGVPLAILYAVGLTESGARERLQPFAVNVEGRSHMARSLPEALSVVAAAKARGGKLIDIGCMQINLFYHGEAFPGVAAMFDPARNVGYAADFLKRLRDRHGDWSTAVARYHAGDRNHAAQRRYVCTVLGHLVRTGFGAWTPEAKGFCANV